MFFRTYSDVFAHPSVRCERGLFVVIPAKDGTRYQAKRGRGIDAAFPAGIQAGAIRYRCKYGKALAIFRF